MAANTNENSGLFTNMDGTPIIFYMRPCAERQTIRPLITQHGGKITSNLTPGCIKLAEKGSTVSGDDYVRTKYVKECIKENKILEIKDYRVKPGTVASADSDDDEESDYSLSPADYIEKRQPGDMKGRTKYSLEEDVAIMKYLVVENRYTETAGMKVWKDMERLQVTNHTGQSMNTRYRKIILPNITGYEPYIESSWVSKLTGVLQKKDSSYSVDDLFKRSYSKKKANEISTTTYSGDPKPKRLYQELDFVTSDTAKRKNCGETISSYFSKESAKPSTDKTTEKSNVTSSNMVKNHCQVSQSSQKDKTNISEPSKSSPAKRTRSKILDLSQEDESVGEENIISSSQEIGNNKTPVNVETSSNKSNERVKGNTQRHSQQSDTTAEETSHEQGTDDRKQNGKRKASDSSKEKSLNDEISQNSGRLMAKEGNIEHMSEIQTRSKSLRNTPTKADKSVIGNKKATGTENRTPKKCNDKYATDNSDRTDHVKSPGKENCDVETNNNKRKTRSNVHNDTKSSPKKAKVGKSLSNNNNSNKTNKNNVSIEIVIDSSAETIENENTNGIQEDLEKDGETMADDIAELMDESFQISGAQTSTPKSADEILDKEDEEDCRVICKNIADRYGLGFETVCSLMYACNGDVKRTLSYIEFGPHSFYSPPWSSKDDALLEDYRNVPALVLKYGETDVQERMLFLEGL